MPGLSKYELSENVIYETFRQFDLDKSNDICFNEFIAKFRSLKKWNIVALKFSITKVIILLILGEPR